MSGRSHAADPATVSLQSVDLKSGTHSMVHWWFTQPLDDRQMPPGPRPGSGRVERWELVESGETVMESGCGGDEGGKKGGDHLIAAPLGASGKRCQDASSWGGRWLLGRTQGRTCPNS